MVCVCRAMRTQCGMPRWLSVLLVFVCPAVVFACNDDVEQEVAQDVCWSEKQWIGGRRGSPEMFPGRDCVGCHLENDGPQLVLGGTVYPYVLGNAELLNTLQTGEDCFGIEGQVVHIEGADGQVFEVTTNRAGNFFVEGSPADLVKPFTAYIDWIDPTTGNMQHTAMVRAFPSYGGCARCHTPGTQYYPPLAERPRRCRNRPSTG